ncbi:flagellin [Hippea maritima]|uniref:Flagellin n=1 Tax=Hippea maritima (strain ATCC 700847 / DSM 10411 / MH2) TaxID=760142 RepID=F2LUJ8_HIPMA|nr:flagellin [Hippea maritima]AEA34588.1 flagellin domain protein [Hippea maritima DSM 10411]
MGLRINTNIAAQYSVFNLNNTNNKLSLSLNRLSTGLRITKAADDAAGMTIADGLKFQSMNLGQAINNGNNAVKLIQIADMALQKSIDIVQTISQKAAQAANATEDPSSREALQAEINKLIEEVNNIANTTSYKDTKLLDGTFTNKIVHIGAYMNQTLSIGAQRTAADSIGWVAQTTSSNHDTYTTSIQDASNSSTEYLQFNTNTNFVELKGGDLTINGIDVANYAAGIDADHQLSAKTMAAAINKVQSETGGVEADATTTVTGSAEITAGTITAGTFKINGVDIGQVNVTAGDADGALVNKINQYSDQTGVVASTDSSGRLVLTAEDGRNIAITADSTAQGILHLSDTETTIHGTTSTIATAMTFYLNGTQISLSANETAASAVTDINNTLASAGIDTTKLYAELYTSGSGHYVKLVANDGRDLNIYVASGQAAASHLDFLGLSSATANHNTRYIANSSNHGTITLTSMDNIEISGDKAAVGGLKTSVVSPNNNLESVDVTSQSGAELAIKIAQSALKDLDSIRSNLGAIQNQIQATVENISVTQININGAESTIRDVNFAQESSNFSKLQILAQSGTYALAQSNAVQQNVLRLLQ